MNNDRKTISLPDNRKLCYTEYGNPEGEPVFAFHGTGNSRLTWAAAGELHLEPRIRLIAPDRPGYGWTDFKNGITTVANWPADIAALADALGIGTFSVFGASGGGPYALSCAWKLPKRVKAAGIFASVGPFIPETDDKRMAASIRLMWKLAPKLPGVFRLQMRLFAWLAKKYPRLYIKAIRNEFSEDDMEIYERLHLADNIQASRNEGYRQKGIGIWYDTTQVPGRWSIPLDEIRTKVYLWQGEKDISVPLSMGKYLAGKLPNCEAHFIKDAGHFWVFEHLNEMLEILV